MSRRVLITGSKGFTGHYLSSELDSCGWTVFGTGKGEDPSDPRYRQIDLADQDGLRDWIKVVQPDAVVHLAGVAFVGHGQPDAFYRVNLIGTRNLLAAIGDAAPDVSCVLLASSANVYGNAQEGVLDESTIPCPANDYAVSKLSMEYMARLWSKKLPIVIARPFNYTGVGQSESFLLPKIVAHFKREAAVIELGNLDVWRDFSDVRALVRGYRRLIEVCPQGEVVNVCSGHVHSLREVLSMAESISGHKLDIRVNPAFVRENEVKTLCGDPSRLKHLIGDWESIPVENTLRWMLE
jgi:nucleoside-diphosphate-sugar epimerase